MFSRLHDDDTFCVAFVCTGNICRSPMAETVLLDLARKAGLADRLHVASSGLGDYHVGETADPRTLRALTQHGLSADSHRAQQFEREWLEHFDLIVALDRGQERALHSMADDDEDSRIKLLRQFDPLADEPDVPDPYYSDEAFFLQVLDQIEAACRGLFAQIEPVLRYLQRTAAHRIPPTDAK